MAEILAVEVVDLVKAYGPNRAVNGLSFTVPAGSVTALLGPNGAGKTTTVEICEGFRRADAGTVLVLGRDPVADAAALRPRVGVMLQSGGMYPGARAGEMLRLVAAHHAHPLDPDTLLERVGLDGTAARTPFRRLSGGQKQLLSLAMAIVGRPELVFLDEPTAGLDVRARHATWDLVEELRAAGVTVVLTTHAMDEAERLADQVVIVDRGAVVAAGTPAELTRGGADGELRFRAPSGLDLDQLLAALPDGSRASERAGGHYIVRGTVDPAFLAAVTAWCAGNGVLPTDLRVEQRSLEDVFVDLTGSELAP
ncbi:ABC transporter ATP-binding protein [Frankia sp. CNm7]|uniref:ABC transporter ATP-binding protein n=1 Tax=Frankia nepalensis TaxID=1836974 RepID=A0A937UTG4_9ACTN|nr:ABC transporter ATP-binding protein [Frankia nepalensis]MBL7494847.1 ABC transporter ATP-binding protein [Frankia nepalensis]MBL7514826.1 ABC transporter ATP-binding protein [Frankia nepalensis]MBL7518712.1 ABC transporter ATP-binding protein [Frankia nepalensis]MBL7633557.1 ABC transporter ATP-binding protein [Frankia nepalensis]